MEDDRPPISLRSLEPCFRGVVPASIATCSPEGIPNVTPLSIVHLVDDDHLALSFQFFNKTRANIEANPKAQLLVVSPSAMEQFRIDARYERTEREGPVFERIRASLDAVASMTGMTSVFRLQGADIYRVTRIEALAHDLDLAEPSAPRDFLGALEALSDRLAACEDLESLLDATLSGLSELLHHRQSMIFLADDASACLFAVASHGFEESGIGAEVALGDGVIGAAALEQEVISIANLRVDQIMAEAVRASAGEQRDRAELGRAIPLPPLTEAPSRIALPILARGRTLGVLYLQADEPGRFTMADEQVLTTLARYVATCMQLLAARADTPPVRSVAPQAATGEPVRIRYHASDDSVFVQDEYVIKGLPGRILHRLLSVYEREGRVDFTNRELRLDRTLQLGGYRDNLEARLILLRRRLEERAMPLRLTKTGRGRFRLELDRPFTILRAP